MPGKQACLGCGQVDDHPKDVWILPDHSATYWHHDCHARSDAGCRACYALTEIRPEGIRGDEYRAHLHTPAVREHLRTNYPDLIIASEAIVQGGGG